MFNFSLYPTPKTIETIPYYHLFPGVLVIDVKRDYLTGMNLFHLPRRFRRFFLTKVLTLRSLETEADDETKITFSYEEMLNEKISVGSRKELRKKICHL